MMKDTQNFHFVPGWGKVVRFFWFFISKPPTGHRLWWPATQASSGVRQSLSRIWSLWMMLGCSVISQSVESIYIWCRSARKSLVSNHNTWSMVSTVLTYPLESSNGPIIYIYIYIRFIYRLSHLITMIKEKKCILPIFRRNPWFL